MIQNTQFLLPGYIVSNGAITGNAWQNPNNILLVDGQVTESNPGAGTASDIVIGGFNPNLPQNAVITGIEMELIAYGGAQTVPPLTLTIEALDNTSGSDVYYPYTAPFSGLTQSLATYTLGTSTYLFNTSFTVDQINNLKFALIANGDISVDSFLMKVFYYIPTTPTPPGPVQTGCVSCNSPIEVPPMYLQLPFLSGQTTFYLKPGSMQYANGQPIQPGDLSACNIGEIDFTFDEGMVKGNSDNNFQEDVALDITTGFWQILPSGVVEVTLGSVNDRGLLPYEPYTHSSSFMSDHQANSKVIISNSGKFYSRFVRACQVGFVFSAPIDVMQNGSDIVNPATKFNFIGAGVNVSNAGSGQANITINGSAVANPLSVGIGSGTSAGIAVSSLTYTIPVSGVNRAAVIQISTQQSVSITSVTVDGIPASHLVTSSDAGTNIRQETWGLVAPHVGTVNVIVTLSGPAFIASGAECYVGVNQASPFGSTQNASGLTNAPTLTLTTANNNSLVVDGLATAITPILYTPGAGQTINWSHTANSDSRQGASSTQLSGTAPDAVIMQYSITQTTRWCYTAIEVNGVPVVTPVVSPLTVQDQAGGVIVANTVKIKVPTGSLTNPLAGEADIDFTSVLTNKVAATGTDTTPDYLTNKILLSSDDGSVTIVKSIDNPAGNEVVEFDLSVPTPSSGALYTVNANEAISSYDTHEVILPSILAGAGLNGWTNSFNSITNFGFNKLFTSSTLADAHIIFSAITPTSNFQFSTGKIVREKFRITTNIYSGNNGDAIAFGLSDSGTFNFTDPTSTDIAIKFVWKRVAGVATLYTVTATGAANTNNPTTSFTDSAENIYEIVWNSSTSVEFYVNGTLIFTHTTHIPIASSDVYLQLGAVETGHADMVVSNPVVSIQS